MKILIRSMIVFLVSSGGYLWLALSEVPFFRIQDVEPHGLIYALFYSCPNGRSFALLTVASFWGLFALMFYFALITLKAELGHKQSQSPTSTKMYSWPSCLASLVLCIGILFIGCYFSLPYWVNLRTFIRCSAMATCLQEFRQKNGYYPGEELIEITYDHGDFERMLFYSLDGSRLFYTRQGDSCILRYKFTPQEGERYLEVKLTPPTD